MKVDYINDLVENEHVRVTFVGYDPATNKRRRPVVDLDAHDLTRLVELARNFRNKQRAVAAMYTDRANRIDTALRESAT